MIVERLDGSLWMLIRIRGEIRETSSYDGGKTWITPEIPEVISHPTFRSSLISRLWKYLSMVAGIVLAGR